MSEFQRALVDKQKWFPDNYHLLIVRFDDEVVAVAAGYYIADINVGFINYVVTDEKHEGKGLGKMLREALLNLFIIDAKNNNLQSPLGYLGEVEHNNPWLKTLIEKYGVKVLDVKYVQPPLGKKRRPMPLALYFQPHQGASVQVEKAFIEKIIRTIYKSIYDIKYPERKKYFKKMLESLR